MTAASSAVRMMSSQKAPSAKRCIKTLAVAPVLARRSCVRKHRAPNGALRHASDHTSGVTLEVRKH